MNNLTKLVENVADAIGPPLEYETEKEFYERVDLAHESLHELQDYTQLLRDTIKKQIKLRREDFKIYTKDDHLEVLTDEAIERTKLLGILS